MARRVERGKHVDCKSASGYQKIRYLSYFPLYNCCSCQRKIDLAPEHQGCRRCEGKCEQLLSLFYLESILWSLTKA